MLKVCKHCKDCDVFDPECERAKVGECPCEQCNIDYLKRNQCPNCGMFMSTERRGGFNLPDDMPWETFCKRCGYEVL